MKGRIGQFPNIGRDDYDPTTISYTVVSTSMMTKYSIQLGDVGYVYSVDVDPCIPDQADPLCEGMLIEM